MEENHTRKAAWLFGILVIVALIFVSTSVDMRPVKAGGDYTIEHAFHTVKIMYNGYVFINDTLELNATMEGPSPSNFLMGLPDKYGQSVLKCIAFSGSDTFPVTLNTPLNGRMGFYGVRIDFPVAAPQVFTVGFVLSSLLLTQSSQNASLFELDFPAYPSLVKEAGVCNVSIIAPSDALFVGGSVSGFSYGKENLQAYDRSPATVDFLLASQNISIVDITALDRDISVSQLGEISGVDSYYITNKAPQALTSFQVFLPPNASDPTATDQFGRQLSNLIQKDAGTNLYEVDFTLSIASGQFGRFTLEYSLPPDYVTRSSDGFNLSLPLFEHENYYINEALTSILLPEGAKIRDVKSNSVGNIDTIQKGMYDEAATLDQKDIIVLNSASLEVTYEYNPLWSSFRPTMWVWAFALVGCVGFVVVRQRPKGPTRAPPSGAASRLDPEFFKSFVETYEEKKKINSELDSLEARVEKGRIPRRRYKVLRRTLEARLDAALRSLSGFKEVMRAAGGKYSGLMLQLEVAETEISEVKANIKNAESLHNRGELSLEAYRNRLADYEHKKERAETTINGILLRIREETR